MPQKFTLASEFADPDLERALLAAIAARPEVYWEVLDLLPPEALTETRQTFEAFAEAIENDEPPLVIEGETLEDPVAAAKKLADLYQKRLLADLTEALLERLRMDIPATDLIAELEDNLARVQQAVRELRAGRVVALPELLPELLADTVARREAVRHQGKSAIGLPTGIGGLDRLLGGLQPGLHLAAAEPGQGKTTFCLQVGTSVVRAGYPVLFISFEESVLRLALKALCSRAGLEAKKFAEGYGDPTELERAASEYASELAALHFVEGTARVTVPQVKARALQVMARGKARKCLIVIDYLQRWAASRRDFSEFRYVVSGLVSELRELALRLDSPLLVISSQNRPGQGTASLASLKESGDLEYSADTVFFLVEAPKRTAVPPARAVDLVIEKNRYGDKGRVELIFRPDIGVFREVART